MIHHQYSFLAILRILLHLIMFLVVMLSNPPFWLIMAKQFDGKNPLMN